MGNIAFEKVSSTFTILNPFNNFTPEEHSVEVRKDPLLGDTSIHNPYLKDKARAFFGPNDPELIQTLARESAKNCIFCGENVVNKTARYPSDILSEGRIRKGEAVLFANLFSVGAYHPVISLSSAHFLRLTEFAPQLLTDGFIAAQEFLRSVYQKDASAAFSAVCANYLLPAGASLVHPHLQMLVTPAAYSYHGRMLDAARRYYEKNGSSYYIRKLSEVGLLLMYCHDLIASHGGKGREPVPIVLLDDGAFAGSYLFSNQVDDDLSDLSRGISRVLFLYERLGHLSFNYALYSVRRGSRNEGQRCVFKIISRQNLYPNYRNDDYFLQKMLQSELIFNLPEELADQLRPLF